MAVAIGTNLTPCSNLSIFLELFTAPPPSTQTTEETAIEDVVPMRSRAKTTHPWDNAVPLRPEDIIGYSSAVCMKYLYSKKCPFEYIPYLACQLSPVLIKNFDSTKAKRKPGVSEETTYDRFNLQKINELLTDAMTDIAKKWSDNPSLIPAAYLSNYKISIHEDRGMRRTMEDRTFVCLNTDALLGPNHTASYSFSSMEDKNIIDTMEQKTSENENNGNNKSNNDHDENNMETNQSDNNSSTITDNADDNNNNNNNDNNNNNNNNNNSNSNNNNINNDDNNNNNDKDNNSSNSSNTPGILIGVYDGHGGVEAAEFVYSQLYRQILTHPKLDTNTSEAITEAFAHTDEGFLNLSQTEGWKSGSTVLVAYARTPNLMHIAWAGDSQAYLYRRGQYVQYYIVLLRGIGIMDLVILPNAYHSSIKFGDVEVATYYLSCLAQATYVIKCNKNAFIVDPRRDVNCYLEELKGFSILGTILTHLHADFVSGHKELIQKGIPTYLGPGAKSRVAFPYKELQDTEPLELSEAYSIVCMHTPGHTKESSCYVLTEKISGGSKPVAVFTGDTLFVKSVGRPDLVNEKDSTPEAMSQLMYTSLYDKLLTLPDDVIVYPAHGPGSPCGTSASAELHSTIGAQRKENPFLQFKGRPNEFINFNCARSLLNPNYFASTVAQNISAGDLLHNSISDLQLLEPVAFQEFLKQDNVVILDTRSNEEFRAQHIKNSIHFFLGGSGGATLRAVDGTFAMLVGNTFRINETIVFVSEVGKESEVLQRLCRIGYAAKAALKGGIEAWKTEGLPLVGSKDVKRIQTDADLQKLHDEGYSFLDVRFPPEYNSNHFTLAENNPLPALRDNAITNLPKDRKYICYCKSGYRSSAATSILDKLGYDACDLYGGFAAISTYAPKMTTKGETDVEMRAIMESLATLHA